MEEDINNYSNLIYSISKKFYGVDKEDLYQAGMLGLLKASKNYKVELNAKFSTYAVSYIFGEMYNLTYNKELKYGKDLLKLYKEIEILRYKLAQEYGRVPSNMDIANYLEKDIKEIDYITSISNNILYLDNNENRDLYEVIPGNNRNMDDALYIEESLNILNPCEREIIKSHYFEDLTQSEIARKLKMTQVMVSRIEKKGKDKLRKYMSV